MAKEKTKKPITIGRGPTSLTAHQAEAYKALAVKTPRSISLLAEKLGLSYKGTAILLKRIGAKGFAKETADGWIKVEK